MSDAAGEPSAGEAALAGRDPALHAARRLTFGPTPALLTELRAEGVDHTFGVVGSTTNTIVTEMYGRDDIRFVDTRHEEGAAFMAYGYARASGKPTACITTSGPGTTNLVTGIALAAKGRAPVLAIAGDVARDYIYRDGSQAFDLVGLFKPITKLALEVNLTARIPEMLHYAFRAMLSGKRGPAFLDIPRDLLDNQTIEGDVLRPEAYRAVDARVAGEQAEVTQLAPVRLVHLHDGAGRSQPDRTGLASLTATFQASLHIPAAEVVGRREGLLDRGDQRRAREIVA